MNKNKECSICLETLNDKKVYITHCNHSFHVDCAYEWLTKNHSCPLCRTYTFFKEILNIGFDYNINYSIRKNINFKKITYNPFKFENNTYNNVYKQLKEQLPSAWINVLNMYNIAPLYTLFNDDKSKYMFVDYHLRQLLIWEDNINLSQIEKHIDLKSNKYYLTSNQSLFDNKKERNRVSKKTNEIMVDWIYDVMKLIRENYNDNQHNTNFNFIYHKSINTLILDLVISSIYHLNLSVSTYQTSIMCSIYTALQLYYKKYEIEIISISKLIELTDFSSKKNDIKMILKFQNKFIDKYINFYY